MVREISGRMDGQREGRDGEGKQALNTNEVTHIMPPSLPLSVSLTASHTHVETVFPPSHTCALSPSSPCLRVGPNAAQEVISASLSISQKESEQRIQR